MQSLLNIRQNVMHYARKRSTFLFVLTINVYLFLEIYIINGPFCPGHDLCILNVIHNARVMRGLFLVKKLLHKIEQRVCECDLLIQNILL